MTVGSMLTNSGLGDSHDSVQFPHGQAVAWDKRKFAKQADSGSCTVVGSDHWGERVICWVKLFHQASGRIVWHFNLHGCLDGCTGSKAQGEAILRVMDTVVSRDPQ